MSLAFVFGEAASAQEPWRFQVTPYVWAPGLVGDIRPDARLPRIDLDRSFSETFDDLDGAFFITGTARHGRIVVLADFTYSEVSESHAWTLRVPVVDRTIDVSVDVETTFTATTLAIGYSVIDRPDLVLDLLAGARLWNGKLDIRLPNLIPRIPDSFSESRTYAEPVVALRARYQVVPDWSVIGYADYGGGIEADSTWQLFGTVNYRITERWFASAGYRALAFAYDDGGFEFDARLGGPVVGATYRF